MLLRTNTRIENAPEQCNNNISNSNAHDNLIGCKDNQMSNISNVNLFNDKISSQNNLNTCNQLNQPNPLYIQTTFDMNQKNYETMSLPDQNTTYNSNFQNQSSSSATCQQYYSNIAPTPSSFNYSQDINTQNIPNSLVFNQSNSCNTNYLSPIYSNSQNNSSVKNIQERNEFNRSSSHMGFVPNQQHLYRHNGYPERQDINNLSHSFSNFAVHNSQLNTQWDTNNCQESNKVHHHDKDVLSLSNIRNNQNNLNENSLNKLPSLNSSSRSLPQSCLTQNNFLNKNLQNLPSSMSISTPAVNPQNQLNATDKNNSNTKLSPPLLIQQKPFSNPITLTPSKRMINVMEERLLIPPTGVMNPVPNLMHITKKPNCNSGIMRCTMNAIPSSEDILSKTRLPLVMLIHPFKDLANLQVIRSEKIVRCRALSCRAYLNPFVSFTDQKRWKCNICQRLNELSDDYLYDESVGSYVETQKRAEIRLATVEYIAPKEYSMKSFQLPVYVFLVDLSVNAVSNLYSNTMTRILNTIDELLDRFPGHKHAKFSLIGYDGNIHLYSITEKKIQEIVISDLSSPIEIPVTTGILVDLSKYRDQIQEILVALLENVDNESQCHSAVNLNCLGSTLLLAKQLIGQYGGRITIFNSSCPNVGEGILSIRDFKKSNSVFPFAPDKEFYKTLSLEFAQAQICVDIFQLGKLPCDLASLSIVSRYCGGSVFHYPDLTIDLSISEKENTENDKSFIEVQRLLYDLNRYLTRKIGFDAVLRVRYSSGLSILSTHGNFFARACDLYSMANINPDSGIAIRMGISDNFIDGNVIFFQVALLYTSSLSERRIRVHTICLPVSSQIDDVFRMADHQAIVGFLVKSVSDKLQSSGKVVEAREALINAIVDPSIAFGEFCLSSSQRLTSLPFPYHLRLLPLYVWGILQSKCLQVSQNDPDSSVAILDAWRNMPLSYLLTEIYPVLYKITSVAFISSKLKGKLNQKEGSVNKTDPGSVVGNELTSNINNNNGNGKNDDEDEEEEEVEHVYSSDSESSSWDSEACSGISCYNSKCDHTCIGYENKNQEENPVESDEDDLWYPEQLHLTMQSLNRSEVYLLDAPKGLILLMGLDTPSVFFRQIFAVDSFLELPSNGNIQLPELNNSASIELRVFVKELQIDRPIGSHLFVINNSHSSLNSLFQSHLIEDDKMDTSYHRFLQHIQRKVNK